MAIFRTLGFGVLPLRSVGVPGFKVSEQLSRELDGYRTPLGLPFMGKEKRERMHTGWGYVLRAQDLPLGSFNHYLICEARRGRVRTVLLLVLTIALNSDALSPIKQSGKEEPTEIKLEWGSKQGFGAKKCRDPLL